jgi:hypothetical protein
VIRDTAHGRYALLQTAGVDEYIAVAVADAGAFGEVAPPEPLAAREPQRRPAAAERKVGGHRRLPRVGSGHHSRNDPSVPRQIGFRHW